jgi:hypothetical protein
VSSESINNKRFVRSADASYPQSMHTALHGSILISEIYLNDLSGLHFRRAAVTVPRLLL